MEDIIITALALAAGLIFKVIEKKLKTAGNSKPKSDPDWEEQLSEMFRAEEPEVVTSAVPAEVVSLPDETADDEASPVQAVSEKAPRTALPKKPVLMEEPKKAKEKIDPKKLVIYSEIMKPKYLE